MPEKIRAHLSHTKVYMLKTKKWYLFLYFCFVWQKILGKPVLDRVGLIIEIFNAHACTKEGKLQVLVLSLVKEFVF